MKRKKERLEKIIDQWIKRHRPLTLIYELMDIADGSTTTIMIEAAQAAKKAGYTVTPQGIGWKIR